MQKVSVIIPFYKGVKWLEDAVESALNQTYDNIEIIVVNDGSCEDVSAFLLKYNHKIRYIYKENGGAASARNLGIAHASGDYIAFLDSDDIWLPEKTEKQISFMEKTGCKWSNTGFYCWYPDTDALKTIDVKNNYDDVFLQSLISLRISTPSVVINKICFTEHPDLKFPTNFKFGEDTAFFNVISRIYPLGLLVEPLMKVRMRGENSFSKAFLRFKFKQQLYEFIKKDPESYMAVPGVILFVYGIYGFYSRMMDRFDRVFSESVREFIAKLLWVFPYMLERIILVFVLASKVKNQKYRA